MKKLYWIDDNIQQMLYIIQGAIMKFWKLNSVEDEGIASKIIVFGNACEVADIDQIPSEKEENKAYLKLFDLFLEGCMEEDGPDPERPTYNAKKNLIQEPVRYLYKQEAEHDLEAYKKMKESWILGDLGDSDDQNYQKAVREVELLIERMEIEPDSVVGIDMALLYDDFERLKNKKRILSMELFHRLSNNEGTSKCFIYSSEADVDEVRRNWEEVYRNFYGHTTIKIYQRMDFMQKGNADIVKEVEEMFK